MKSGGQLMVQIPKQIAKDLDVEERDQLELIIRKTGMKVEKKKHKKKEESNPKPITQPE